MDKFVLKAPYQPTGDQPQAIEALVKGSREDFYHGQRDPGIEQANAGHRTQ